MCFSASWHVPKVLHHFRPFGTSWSMARTHHGGTVFDSSGWRHQPDFLAGLRALQVFWQQQRIAKEPCLTFKRNSKEESQRMHKHKGSLTFHDLHEPNNDCSCTPKASQVRRIICWFAEFRTPCRRALGFADLLRDLLTSNPKPTTDRTSAALIL